MATFNQSTASMAPVERLADYLEKPELDDRSYRVVKLPNKLEALLVHDSDTDKASAALSVEVGSYSDAEDMPGMAHAVEHLLFMGTKKFPIENEYSQYLAAHAGYSNAFTMPTETNYHFEVAATGESHDASHTLANGVNGEHARKNSEADAKSTSPLYGALDRFAQFFIEPLFLAETLDRELRAVDSENKKNLQTDGWRLRQLDKTLSNPKHPYHKFSTGNLSTLRDEPQKRGVNIRDEFIKFYSKHYSANRMKLCVLGKESLDQLEAWVAELFADVKNMDLPRNRWDGEEPYAAGDLLTQVCAKPVMDTRSLEITWTYRDEEHLYRSQPFRYLSHLIGHEGPGSILAYIKAKGWATGLYAGAQASAPGAWHFEVHIRLTTEGLERYQEVVGTVFKYIALVKNAGPQKWIQDETKEMTEVDFRFKQKSPATRFTRSICATMQKDIPREWLLSGERVIREFDREEVLNSLSYLRADNYRLTIVSQQFPGNWDRKEPWYGTEYRLEKVPEKLQAIVRKALDSRPEEIPAQLHLPHKNQFIPTRLNVERKEVDKPLPAPRLIRNDASARVWWKKDDHFWVPKGTLNVLMRSPLAAITPENAVKATLYAALVKDELNEYSYDAQLSGLDYDLSDTAHGLSVQISGYNDKMPVLLEKVLTIMRDIEIKPDRFDIVKDRLLRAFRNWDFQQSWEQCGDLLRWLFNPTGWIVEQQLAELPQITREDVAAFYPQLLKQLHLEAVVHGNLYKEDALRMIQLIETTLRPRSLPRAQWQTKRSFIYPRGSDFKFRRTLVDPANVNNYTDYVIQIGDAADMNLRAKTLLLAQMSNELCFDHLRTKEQLGYIVSSGWRMLPTMITFHVAVQSERSTDYLESRINAFLMTFLKTLEDMPKSEFDSHKRSVIKTRLERPKNLSQEFSRIYSHIWDQYYYFAQREDEAAEIRPLTKNDMLDFFNHYISPLSSHRAKLSVHMVAQTSPKEVAGSMSTGEQKEKVLHTLEKYLTAGGIGVDPEKLAMRFDAVNITGGDQAAILGAISKYVEDDAKAPKDQVSMILQQGAQLLGTILPALGIEVKKVGEEGLPKAPDVKEPTLIENVPEFKASLQVTAAPKPIVDLSEYEELDAKL